MTKYVFCILTKFQYSPQIFGKYMSEFMAIRPVGAEVFHVDGRTNKHEGVNIHFS
jgi:hypothetical protein